MLEHYMLKIEMIFGLKENQNLSSKERQEKIKEVLSEMRTEVESLKLNSIKKDLKEKINNLVNEL